MAEISSSDDESNSSSKSLNSLNASTVPEEDNLKVLLNGFETTNGALEPVPDLIEQEITESLDQLSTNNHRNTLCDNRSESSEEQIRKRIRVGNHYQARIPKFVPSKIQSAQEELLWDPYVIEENTVEDFLKKISSLTKLIIPLGTHLRDDERALYVLQKHSHDVRTAFEVLSESVPDNTSSVWTEEECRSFESGLLNFGKNFFLIQKYKVSTRQIGELVQFYYLWKKTERYDLLASRIRTGKKKYALNPGMSDLVCRYLGGQRRSSGNSSPDVQFVVTDSGSKKEVAQSNSQY